MTASQLTLTLRLRSQRDTLIGRCRLFTTQNYLILVMERSLVLFLLILVSLFAQTLPMLKVLVECFLVKDLMMESLCLKR